MQLLNYLITDAHPYGDLTLLNHFKCQRHEPTVTF
jgi:hypothetical protein